VDELDVVDIQRDELGPRRPRQREAAPQQRRVAAVGWPVGVEVRHDLAYQVGGRRSRLLSRGALRASDARERQTHPVVRGRRHPPRERYRLETAVTLRPTIDGLHVAARLTTGRDVCARLNALSGSPAT
jgi:hypothetical protein